MNAELNRAFTDEEIKVVLFQIHLQKTFGPDGLPPLFF